MKTARAFAFTMVEMMLALGVTSLIVVAMLRLFMEGTTLWQRYDQKLDTFREARAAMQLMARDFGGLRPATAAPVDFPILALDVHPDTQEEDKVNQEIYALTGVRNSGGNDLCAVGYFCAWNAEKNAFVLRRQCTESSTTFSLLDDTLRMKPPATALPTSIQASGSIFDRTVNDKLNKKVQSMEDLATYVWDFKVVVPDPADPTKELAWPQGRFSRELPLWVEIHFKALGVNAARKIAGSGVTRETWFQPDSPLYRTMILPGEQQFVTRIKLCR